MMLAFEKHLPDSWFDAPPDRWFQADLGTLYGKTLGIVGLGGIGERAAALARPFDMRIKALRRSLRPADTARASKSSARSPRCSTVPITW